MRRIAALLLAVVLIASPAIAQKKPMTNADVVKLTRSGHERRRDHQIHQHQ
jgi:hypothetical protein